MLEKVPQLTRKWKSLTTRVLKGARSQVTSGTPLTGLAPELYERTRYDLPRN